MSRPLFVYSLLTSSPQAEQKLLSTPNIDHEYLPITGLPEFTGAAAKLILGSDSPAIAEGRVTSVQTISGTGANHLGALFVARFYTWGGNKQVFLSDPTWGSFRQVICSHCTHSLPFIVNHFAIFKNVGVEPLTYPYYNPATIGLDFDGLIASLTSAPPRSIYLLHACAHNPTGVDPTKEQWGKIADVMLEKGHYAFFDCAYQGFASGDLDGDAWAVREFVRRGVSLLVCQVCGECELVVAPTSCRSLSELRQERWIVWRACRRTSCRVSGQGDCRPGQESAFCITAERDQ